MRVSAWYWAILLALAHAALALGFSSATPYRQVGVVDGEFRLDIGAPDERAHANYIRHLLQGKGFPVLDPMAPDLHETFQAHQPPLYYLLATGWAKWLGIDDVDAPQARRLRWLGALFAVATVLGVFAAAREAGFADGAALGAAALVAFLPMEAAIQGAVTNDGLLYALSAWSLYAAIRHAHRPCWGSALLAGALVGLALLTKSVGMALLPVLIAAGLFAGRRWRVASLVGVALALAIVLPWWVRNHQVYGDFLGVDLFHRAFGRDVFMAQMGPLDFAKFWFNLLRSSVLSFVGLFGYMGIQLHWGWYAACWAGVCLLLLAWAGRGEGLDRATGWLVGVFIALAIAFYVRFNMEFHQPQARYVMHALPALALGLAAGARKRFARPGLALGAVAAVFLTTAVYSLIWVLPREFAALMGR